MKRIVCKDYQSELNASCGRDRELSVAAVKHLANCSDCQTARRENQQLREMIKGLNQVAAPADFNHRLRARLNHEKSAQQKFVWRGWRVALPAAVAAAGLAAVLVATSNPLDNSPNNTASIAPGETTAVFGHEITRQNEQNRIEAVVDDNAGNVGTDIPMQPVAAANANALSGTTNPNYAAQNVETGQRRRFKGKESGGQTAADKSRRQSKAKRLPATPELIISRDIAVRNAPPPLTPRGFPNDPAQSQVRSGSNSSMQNKTLKVADLLQFAGIKTQNEASGLRVADVAPNSIGAYSGVQKNDVIEKINGRATADSITGTNGEVTLVIRRSGQQQTVTLRGQPK